MEGFGVRHYDGKKHYFSVLSPEDLSVFKTLDLPFDIDDRVYSGSCGGLLYFQGEKGKIVIVNLTTNESIVVPPPNFDPLADKGVLSASGLGYDASSGDYKVIRHCIQDYCDDEDNYCGFKDFFDLYQFNSFGSWKEPRTDGYSGYLYDGTGVYVGETGSCYWVGLSDDLFHVVSFDFAIERFGVFPLPASTICLDIRYKLVRYCGTLGAIVYDVTDSLLPKYKLPVELYVWKGKGGSWERVYDVAYIEDAQIPVGLKDNRLFLEAKPSGGCSQLMVYDFNTKRSEKLNIYHDEYPRRMCVISYGAENTDPPLPDSIPKANYDFSSKMMTSNKGKAKEKAKAKAKKRSGNGKGKGKKSRR